MDDLFAAANEFKPQGEVLSIQAYGSGNLNDTFLVTVDSEEAKHFILQLINTRVFRQPELLMLNMRTVTEHVRKRLEEAPLSGGRRWELPRVLLTRAGTDHWRGSGGSFWRAMSFIESAESFDTIKDMDHAREVGYALGLFHNLLSDLPTRNLADTLEGFHVTPRYLRHYDEVLTHRPPGKSPEVDYALQFVRDRRACAYILEKAKERGVLVLRPIHGDPKADNVLIDNATRQAVSVVDLDTVKPGLIHYDLGDCIRSCCNPLGEETQRWEEVRFEPEFCRAILQGYLSRAKGFLNAGDYDYMFDAIRLIAFELGLRFFTDYLEGNVYFKVKRKEHNLMRGLVQFKLTESIESKETEIRNIIADMK